MSQALNEELRIWVERTEALLFGEDRQKGKKFTR